MITISGKNYYIDFNKIDEMLKYDKTNEDECLSNFETITNFGLNDELIGKSIKEIKTTQEPQINAIKYDMIMMCLNVILQSSDEFDDKLGNVIEKQSIQFKLAFNSLLINKIITEL